MSPSELTSEFIQILSLRGDGQMVSFPLPAGKGVFVGSAGNCGLQLSGPEIAPIHCRIAYDGKDIQVHDWMSSSGTYLDGEKVDGESQAFVGSSIQIGNHILKLAANPESQNPPQIQPGPSSQSPLPNSVEEFGAGPDSQTCLGPSDLDDRDPFGQDLTSGQWQQSESPAELQSQARSLTISSKSSDLRESSRGLETLNKVDECTPNERQEGLALQENHETQDAHQESWSDDDWATGSLSSLWELEAVTENSQRSSRSSWDPDEEQATTNHLETRVRDLILEAELSDQRIAALEDLLLAAESAQAAQAEERQCLEAWLQDIESKFSARESEHAAEVELLQKALRGKGEELHQLHGRLSSKSHQSDSNSELLALLEHLRDANTQLEEQLQECRHNCRQLEQQLSSCDHQNSAEVRAQLAELAIERAELARQRHDLVNQLSHTGRIDREASAEDSEMACRLRALREHLREIHRQEQQDRSDRSLTARLSNLWNRVAR